MMLMQAFPALHLQPWEERTRVAYRQDLHPYTVEVEPLLVAPKQQTKAASFAAQKSGEAQTWEEEPLSVIPQPTASMVDDGSPHLLQACFVQLLPHERRSNSATPQMRREAQGSKRALPAELF